MLADKIGLALHRLQASTTLNPAPISWTAVPPYNVMTWLCCWCRRPLLHSFITLDPNTAVCFCPVCLLRKGVLCTALHPLIGSRQNAIRAVLFNFLFGFVTVLYADIASVCGSLGSLFMTICICVSTFAMEPISSRKIGKTRVAKLEMVNLRLGDREAID